MPQVPADAAGAGRCGGGDGGGTSPAAAFEDNFSIPQYMGSRMESRVVIGEVFALYCQHSEHPATCKHHCHWNSHWKRCFMDHSPLLEQL